MKHDFMTFRLWKAPNKKTIYHHETILPFRCVINLLKRKKITITGNTGESFSTTEIFICQQRSIDFFLWQTIFKAFGFYSFAGDCEKTKIVSLFYAKHY